MRFLRNVLFFVLIAATFAVSLISTLTRYPETYPAAPAVRGIGQDFKKLALDGFANLKSPVDPIFALSVALVVLCVVAALLGRAARPKPLFLVRSEGTDSSSMTELAARHRIMANLGSDPDWTCTRLRLTRERNGVRARASVILKTMDNVSGVQDRLRERIHDLLTDDLRVETVAGVEVIVEGFGKKTKREAKRLGMARAEAEVKANEAAAEAETEAVAREARAANALPAKPAAAHGQSAPTAGTISPVSDQPWPKFGEKGNLTVADKPGPGTTI